jgi:hypothetical protein
LAQARAVRCLLVRQSKEKKERQKQQTKRKRIMLLILAMGSDFRCSVGTVKSVGLEDHNKKGRAARYGEARRWWDLNDDTGASRCERIFE